LGIDADGDAVPLAADEVTVPAVGALVGLLLQLGSREIDEGTAKQLRLQAGETRIVDELDLQPLIDLRRVGARRQIEANEDAAVPFFRQTPFQIEDEVAVTPRRLEETPAD